MNNNEHLALFILGIGTLGITFLLLFAITDKDTGGVPALEKQVQVSSAQASIDPNTYTQPVPQSQAQAQPQQDATSQAQASMEALDRQVAETFEKTAAYLGEGTFKEDEHIALLKRLEFYSGMSSIKPEIRKTAQDFIKDMDRLLTLKESVARQVKISGQISAVETDVQIHLASGERDPSVGLKLMKRIENLYSIQGLTEEQNRQLRTSLGLLKKAYSAREKTTAPATSTVAKKTVKKTSEPAKTTVVSKPKVEQKASVAAKAEPKPKVQPKAEPKPVVPAAPIVKAVPKKPKRPDAESVTKDYNKVMTLISLYFTARKFDQKKHDELTADLNEVNKYSDLLSEENQRRLIQTIEQMKRIKMKYGSASSGK